MHSELVPTPAILSSKNDDRGYGHHTVAAQPMRLGVNTDGLYDLCMLYIVGGCSRSGKSILADRMRAHHGIPWLSLDALKMSLYLGAPALGVMAAGEDLDTADQMWPFVEPILDHAIFDRRDYLVEGVNLRPTTVARYIRELEEPVGACFLGYPDIDIAAKASAVERHVDPPADWLHRTGSEHVRDYLTHSRELSRSLRAECGLLGIPFVDTGLDFHAGIDAAERVLSGMVTA